MYYFDTTSLHIAPAVRKWDGFIKTRVISSFTWRANLPSSALWFHLAVLALLSARRPITPAGCRVPENKVRKVHSVLFHRKKTNPIFHFIWQCDQLHIFVLVRRTWRSDPYNSHLHVSPENQCIFNNWILKRGGTLHASKAEHALQSMGTGCWLIIKIRVTWVKHCFSLA